MGTSNVVNYAASPNPDAQVRPVNYEGTDTIYEGYVFCFNQDTTTNKSGVNSGVTAEGSQNEGKYWYAEKPATANLKFLAGVVKGTGWAGKAGPGVVDVYEPNGAIVPVRGSSSFTIGEKVYITSASYAVNNEGGVFVGYAMETIDRSTTNGLVLVQLKQPVEAAAEIMVRSRTTVQLPTAAIWDNFDLDALRANPMAGVLVETDFTRPGGAPDNTFTDAQGTQEQTVEAKHAGEYTLFETTDNQGAEAQWMAPITVSGAGKWAFEIRIKQSVITDARFGWFAGLGLIATLAGDQIADAGTLVSEHCVGFQCKEADGDKIDVVYVESGTAQNEHAADFATQEADTFLTLGLYYNGTTIQMYLNGVASGTAISAVDIAAADFPTAETGLVPSVYMKNAHADDATVTIDWVRAAQNSA